MIYTITFSPSIDYIINNDKNLKLDNINRITNYDFFPGGKGINASMVLKRIGFDNKAICFAGGSTFSLFKTLLKKEKINILNIKSNLDTRINIKYFDSQYNFEINGKKPILTNKLFTSLIKKIEKIKIGDIVFVMGTSDEKYLKELVEIIRKKGAEVVLDIDSKIVLDLLKYEPFVIKPNIYELENMLDKKINNDVDVYNSMVFLKEKGAKNIIVSNGSKGSYLLTNENEFLKIDFPKIDNVISTVGAGDTLIASFAAYLSKTNNYYESIKKATALSIGTSCSKWLAKKNDINKFKNIININKIIY